MGDPVSLMPPPGTLEFRFQELRDELFAAIDDRLGSRGGRIPGPVVVGAPGSIKSPNFVSGSSGWRIGGAGNAEFNNVTVRGTLDASTITASTVSGENGLIVGAPGSIESANYVADTSGWRIGGAGNAEFNNIEARGTIYATAGELSALTVTGTITLGANGVITSNQADGNPYVYWQSAGADTIYFASNSGETLPAQIYSVKDTGSPIDPRLEIRGPNVSGAVSGFIVWKDHVEAFRDFHLLSPYDLYILGGDAYITGDINQVGDLIITGGIDASGTVDCNKVELDADGTKTAPAIYWAGDTDTGLFRPTDNVIGFSGGDTEGLRVTATDTDNMVWLRVGGAFKKVEASTDTDSAGKTYLVVDL